VHSSSLKTPMDLKSSTFFSSVNLLMASTLESMWYSPISSALAEGRYNYLTRNRTSPHDLILQTSR
jgi:hypothetical protein